MIEYFQLQIEELNKLSFVSFLNYFKKLSIEKQIELINNPFLLSLSDDNFRILLFNIDDKFVVNILESEKLYNKVLNLKGNGKRTILQVLETNKPYLLKLILESNYSENFFEQFKNYFEDMDINKFKHLISNIDIKKLTKKLVDYENDNKLSEFIKTKFKQEIDNTFDDIINILINKLHNNKLNPSYLFKINNYKELILFTKFNMLIKVDIDSDDIVLNKGLVLPYKEIIKIKESKINKLIELLQQKEDINDEDLLELSLKLYYIFGFDNAKKILEDKFTNMTSSALTRISDFKYKSERREYRTKNQQKFYYYGMVDKVLESLKNGSNDIFELLTYNGDENEINIIKQEFASLLNQYPQNQELKMKIKEKIKEKIGLREQQCKDSIYKDLYKKYQITPGKKLNISKLIGLFKSIDLKKIITTFDSNTLKDINTFLLGNTKSNNDCLFRLILNEEAFGLNNNLSQLINNFKLIKSIAFKGNLSLNSVLDVIDILKVNLYHLRPNEQDISLEILTKVINSTEFCTKDNNNIVREICNLHVNRKSKVYSSIPTVKGKNGDFTYEVAPFDADYLLMAGCESKNCFKISGKGEDFFRYCLTSNHAVVIYISGHNHTYICPTVRSGNIINVNNISPDIEKDEENYVIDTLKKCLIDIIEKANIHEDHTKNIEIATLTSWHLEIFFKNCNYEKISLTESIPLDTDCYNDYNKRDITNYILLKNDEDSKPIYYLSSDKFYQERKLNYEFDINTEYDKEKLSLIVNSIYYTSIDYQKLTDDEKNKKRRDFEKLDVSEFRYIIGNKDWYVAIDEQFNILANLLPYDDRAKQDYFKTLANISNLVNQIREENNYDRQNSRKNR